MTKKFNYKVEKFADIEILRYEVPEFETLSLQQKTLLYYLSEAALQGRDILYDQKGKYNLLIRRTLESIYLNSTTEKNSEWNAFEEYLKRVWFSNGIHHHYASDKFNPNFSEDFLKKEIKALPLDVLPLKEVGSKERLVEILLPILFDSKVLPKQVNQADGADLLLTSASNYYVGVTQSEAENFYNEIGDKDCEKPISYGLNSRLIKSDESLKEKVYKCGGLYSKAIEQIIYWLDKAATVSENSNQKAVIEALITYYQTGDLKQFDLYSINWLKDLDSKVDFVNGFIESYGDPLGIKGSWESTVNFKNEKATLRAEIISNNAQWFEDHSPIDKQFKKEKVKGVSAKVITVVMLGGDCYPSTPIGINLPNSDWVRKEHGSKSVTIENITEAYDKASVGSKFLDEFVIGDEEKELLRNFSFQTDNLHTDLHECLGHGSGKLLPKVSSDALKAYGATIEEARADLFALYYLADPKMLELGLLNHKDAYKSEYYKYMMNGLLTQLTRIKLGNEIEESHMRNRQLIAQWVLKHAEKSAVELVKKNGKWYVEIADYQALKSVFGELLCEIQRIKSEGDYDAARQLVETYGVKIDSTIHQQILERFYPLDIPPYKGFINPLFVLKKNEKGEIKDVYLDYSEGYVDQMIRYSKTYSLLPTINE